MYCGDRAASIRAHCFPTRHHHGLYVLLSWTFLYAAFVTVGLHLRQFIVPPTLVLGSFDEPLYTTVLVCATHVSREYLGSELENLVLLCSLLKGLYGEEVVKILSRPGKMGLGTAYVDGLRIITGTHVILMDADMSHHPK